MDRDTYSLLIMSLLLLAAAILVVVVVREEFGDAIARWWRRHYSSKEEVRPFNFDHLKNRLRPPCDLPPPGWYCTRGKGHPGPCAALRNNDPRCPECSMVGFHKMSCDHPRESV